MKTPLLALVMVALTHAASAQVVVTHSSVAPSLDIVLSHPLPSAENRAGNTWRWREESEQPRNETAQLFQTDTAFNLTGIVLHAPSSSQTTVDRPFKLIVEKFTGATLNGGREEVSAQSGLLPSFGAGGYIHFSLGQAVAIEADQIYGLRLAFDGPQTSNTMGFTLDNIGTTLPFGEYFYYYNPSISANLIPIATQTAVYYITGSVVPEPGVVTLGALGGFGLLLFASRLRPRKRSGFSV
ncbi:MAG TPA: hypothetical protein VNQ90_12825 [Chthoniobacteraceae bacterium]|nr:hypothetical protein [Chthoniobacteraceae bacterium]